MTQRVWNSESIDSWTKVDSSLINWAVAKKDKKPIIPVSRETATTTVISITVECDLYFSGDQLSQKCRAMKHCRTRARTQKTRFSKSRNPESSNPEIHSQWTASETVRSLWIGSESMGQWKNFTERTEYLYHSIVVKFSIFFDKTLQFLSTKFDNCVFHSCVGNTCGRVSFWNLVILPRQVDKMLSQRFFHRFVFLCKKRVAMWNDKKKVELEWRILKLEFVPEKLQQLERYQIQFEEGFDEFLNISSVSVSFWSMETLIKKSCLVSCNNRVLKTESQSICFLSWGENSLKKCAWTRWKIVALKKLLSYPSSCSYRSGQALLRSTQKTAIWNC